MALLVNNNGFSKQNVIDLFEAQNNLSDVQDNIMERTRSRAKVLGFIVGIAVLVTFTIIAKIKSDSLPHLGNAIHPDYLSIHQRWWGGLVAGGGMVGGQLLSISIWKIGSHILNEKYFLQNQEFEDLKNLIDQSNDDAFSASIEDPEAIPNQLCKRIFDSIDITYTNIKKLSGDMELTNYYNWSHPELNRKYTQCVQQLLTKCSQNQLAIARNRWFHKPWILMIPISSNLSNAQTVINNITETART